MKKQSLRYLYLRLISSLSQLREVAVVDIQRGLDNGTSHLVLSFIPLTPVGYEESGSISITLSPPPGKEDLKNYLQLNLRILRGIADCLSSSCDMVDQEFSDQSTQQGSTYTDLMMVTTVTSLPTLLGTKTESGAEPPSDTSYQRPGVGKLLRQ